MATDETAQPSAERAVRALERAAAAAEGHAPGEIVVASRADLDVLPIDVLRLALDRVLMGPSPEGGLDALLDGGVLPALLPEVHAMIGFGDGEWRHKDVWKHTKQVVAQAVPKVEVRWGSLLHDIGKVKTRSISPDGEVHFFGHAEVGARMFDKIDRRVPLFAKEPSLKSAVLPIRVPVASGFATVAVNVSAGPAPRPSLDSVQRTVRVLAS